MLGKDGIDATTTCNRRLRFIEIGHCLWAYLQGSCLQLPRTRQKASQIIAYRASGRCEQLPSNSPISFPHQFLRGVQISRFHGGKEA